MTDPSLHAAKQTREAFPRATLYLLLGMLGILILGGTLLLAVQRYTPYRQIRVGGPFEMTEMNGRPVTEKDLRGKPAALFFGFTFCPDVCPTTLFTLSNVMKRMGADADRLNVVFVTVDPQRDTPEQMKLYLSSFDPRIRGLTGTDAQVAAMTNAFHVFYHRVPTEGGGYTMDHFAGVLLVDKAGGMVGELPYEEAEESVFAKLTTLVSPAACVPGSPPRVDLWSGARMKDACGSS